MKYKKSFYNIVVKFDNFQIIYNTRTSAIAKLSNSSSNKLDEFLQTNNNTLIDNDILLLIKNGFIISEKIDEHELVRNRYLENFYDKNKLNLTILPVEFCNLRCPYCFIYRYNNEKISKETKSQILNLINYKITNSIKSKAFNLKINWYGGEPLLGLDDINDIMISIKNLIASFNIKTHQTINISSDIITNGVLLNKTTFLSLYNLGIHEFQVTFDGGKPFHDKTRCFANGKGSFDIITKNIKDIHSIKDIDFSFNIRINFMKNSLNSVYSLIDNLVELIGTDNRFSIYARPVYNFETSRDDIEAVKNNIFSTDEGLKIQKEITRYITTKLKSHSPNFSFDLIPFTKVNWCPEDNDYSFIIGCNGLIYKCDTLIGDKKYSLCDIHDLNLKMPKDNFWVKNLFQIDAYNKCYKCKLFPICFGGCKRNIYEGINSCFFDENFIRSLIKESFGERR